MTRYKRQMMLDLLVTAFEGGSNYWLTNPATVCERDTDLNYIRVVIVPDETGDLALDHEYDITVKTIEVGLKRLHEAALKQAFPSAGDHYKDAITEDGDSITADVVLQMGMFGQLIFG